LKLVPSQTRALTALARMALKERNAAAALPYARTLARLQPKSKVALVLLGDAQRLSGDLTSARATWQKAARLGAKDAKQRLRDSAK
jgi:Flp pilus assembly protein TadD